MRPVTHAIKTKDDDWEWAKRHVVEDTSAWNSTSDLMAELLHEYRQHWDQPD